MKLFNFLKFFGQRKGNSTQNQNQGTNTDIPKIPRELFIDESDPEFSGFGWGKDKKVGLDLVYDYLQIDFERKGYEDALVAPDEKYMLDNINILLYDLNILAQKADHYYTKIIKDIEFHIESRKRLGLVDLVIELQSQRDMAIYEMEKLKLILDDIKSGNGATKRIEASYRKGFLRGVYSISKSKILNN